MSKTRKQTRIEIVLGILEEYESAMHALTSPVLRQEIARKIVEALGKEEEAWRMRKQQQK